MTFFWKLDIIKRQFDREGALNMENNVNGLETGEQTAANQQQTAIQGNGQKVSSGTTPGMENAAYAINGAARSTADTPYGFDGTAPGTGASNSFHGTTQQDEPSRQYSNRNSSQYGQNYSNTNSYNTSTQDYSNTSPYNTSTQNTAQYANRYPPNVYAQASYGQNPYGQAYYQQPGHANPQFAAFGPHTAPISTGQSFLVLFTGLFLPAILGFILLLATSESGPGARLFAALAPYAVSLIILLVWAFGDNVNVNKRNLSRAMLLVYLICFILGIILFIIAMSIFRNQIDLWRYTY